MILKSYIVEENIKILGEYKAVLLYGENEGIKDYTEFDGINDDWEEFNERDSSGKRIKKV